MDEKTSSQRITPEVAYVASKDMLNKAIDETELKIKKIKYLQKVALISSLVLGIAFGILSANILSVIAPIVIINGAYNFNIGPHLEAHKNILQEGIKLKEQLEKGEIDPRDFYESRQERAKAAGSNVFTTYSHDANQLTPAERDMLTRFNGPINMQPINDSNNAVDVTDNGGPLQPNNKTVDGSKKPTSYNSDFSSSVVNSEGGKRR